MIPKLDIIRRLTNQASQLVRFLTFDIELDLDFDEAEVLEELEARGYGFHGLS